MSGPEEMAGQEQGQEVDGLGLQFVADGVVGEPPADDARELINPVRLNKKAFACGSKLMYSTNWITNGYWLVHKDRVKNYRAFEDGQTVGVWIECTGVKLDDVAQNTDNVLQGLVPADPFELFELSAWCDTARNVAVFTSDQGEVLFMDQALVDHFGLVSVFAHARRGAVVDDPDRPRLVVTTRRDVELDVTSLEGMLMWAKRRKE